MGYWMQLKDMFAHFQTNFPLLLPRMSATLFRPAEWEAWKDMGFAPEDIQKKTFALYRQYMPNMWQSDEFDQLSEELIQSFDRLYQYIEQNILKGTE